MTSTPAVLALEDGTVFRGISIGASGVTTGEVVFNTAMTGYQEILTDPSYARQIVTLTYPHIGNTGVTPEDLESDSVHAAGLVIRDLPLLHSSWRASHSLSQFLVEGETVAIAGIDTRKLTRILRERGAQGGCIATADRADADVALRAGARLPGPQGHGSRQGRVGARALPVERGQHRPRGGARAAAGLRACTSSPTTSASSATSCACSPTTAAA